MKGMREMSESDNKIRILVAEDMEPIRKRYVKILSDADDMEVVSNVGSGAEAVARFKETLPDVILMDIEMEESDSGLRASQEILEERPETKIIILTVYKEDELIFTAFQLGVCDYIVKNARPEEILNSVRNAYKGESPLRPELADKILGEFKRVRSYETSFLYAVNIVSDLTPTELGILELLIEGKSRRDICEIRHVEMSTVKTQIHNILTKFNRSSTDDVIKQIKKMHLDDFISKRVNL